MQFVDNILLVSGQISKNAVQLNSLNQILTELDERKPLGHTLDESPIVVRVLQLIKVFLDLHRHSLK